MNFSPMLDPLVIVAIVAVFALLMLKPLITARGVQAKMVWLGRIIVVGLLGVLLVRPTILSADIEVPHRDIDIYLVIDITASMGAEDGPDGKTRLEMVKEDTADLVAQFPGAKFSVITFAAQTQLILPLTTDRNAVVSAVSVLRVEPALYSGGTSVTQSIDTLGEQLALNWQQDQYRARAVYYFGDGEHTRVEPPQSFASIAHFVGGGMAYGYGTEDGGRMLAQLGLGEIGEYIIDPATKEEALSRIDHNQLWTLAQQLGVGYQHRSGTGELQLGSVQLASLTQSGAGLMQQREELYWFAAAGIVLILGGELGAIIVELVQTRRLRKGVSA